MRAFLFYLTGFLSLTIVSGCAQRLDEFELRMKDVDERMKLIESRSGGPVGSDRELLEGRKIADVRTQMAAMKNEVTVMSGKMEAMEFEMKTLKDQMEALRRELDRRPQASTEPAPQPLATDGKEAKYREALSAHQGGDYTKARRLFEEFVRENPKSQLADNAVYWMGESYMIEREYKKAMIRFDDLIVKFPNSDKKCDARDRQIEALKALGLEDQVKTFTDLRNAECKK